MTRKKRKAKNQDILPQDESVQVGADLTDSTTGENEPESAELDSTRNSSEGEAHAEPTPDRESEPVEVESPDETLAPVGEEDSSADDPLDEIRRSLVEEEETQDSQKSKTWWSQITKGLQKEKVTEVVPAGNLPAELSPETENVETLEEVGKTDSPEDYEDEIEELIEALKTPAMESAGQEELPETSVPESETAVDIEELKKRALQPGVDSGRSDATDDVRSIALDGGEEILVEVQATRQNTFDERLKGFENALRPYRRMVYLGFAVLGAVLVAVAAIVLFAVYQRLRPVQPVEQVNLPYPTQVSLPGGLDFFLERGVLNDGQWTPGGPEWLEGTELCRWVAIPWSRQMEAVIRTLNPDDPIELTMSNNDRLVYRVYSLREVSVDELQELDTDTPCLLLILARADSDRRWVLTALP